MVKNDAVFRGKPRERLARGIEIHCFQSGASRKGGFRSERADRVGKIDFGKVGAVCESAARNARDLFSVILFGNGDGIYQTDAVARRHGVAARRGHICIVKNRFDPERVYGYIVLRQIPGRKRIAVRVGIGNTCTVRCAEPTAERSRSVRRVRHVERIILSVINGSFFKSVCTAVQYRICLGRIVGIKHQLARRNEEFIRKRSAVAGGAVRRIVPGDKVVPGFEACLRQGDLVADRFIQRGGCVPSAAVKCYRMRGDFRFRPFRNISSAHEADAEHVFAFRAERIENIEAFAVIDGRNRLTVERDFVTVCSGDGVPVQNVVVVGGSFADRIVVEHKFFGKGFGAPFYDLQLQGIARAFRPGEEGAVQFKGRLLERLVVDRFAVYKNVVNSAVYGVPAQQRAVQPKSVGKGGGRFRIFDGDRLGAIESLRGGRNGYGAGAFLKFFQGELCAEHAVRFAAHRNEVGGRAFHGRPAHHIVFDGKRGDLVEVALENDRCFRGRIPVRHGGHGKHDAARLHVAVCKIIVQRRSVIESVVVMRGVSAVNGDEIFFRMFHAAEYERVRFDHAQPGNAGKPVIYKVAFYLLRKGISVCVDRRNFGTVNARFVHRYGDGRTRLAAAVDDARAVGGDKRNDVCSRADGIPTHRLLRKAHCRVVAYGAVLLPYGEQGRVCIEYGAFGVSGRLFETVAEPRGVVFRADPPADKGVTAARSRHSRVIKFSSDGFGVGDPFAVITKVIGYGIFFPVRFLRPTRVEGQVTRNCLRTEKERRGVFRIGIPTQEHMPAVSRVGGRFLQRFPVQYAHARHFAAARRVERHGEIHLFEEAHLRIFVLERDDVPVQGSGLRPISGREGKCRTFEGIGAVFYLIVGYEGEGASFSEGQQIFAAGRGVVIIYARFCARLGRRYGFLVVACDEDGCRKCAARQSDRRDKESESESFSHFLHIPLLRLSAIPRHGDLCSCRR